MPTVDEVLTQIQALPDDSINYLMQLAPRENYKHRLFAAKYVEAFDLTTASAAVGKTSSYGSKVLKLPAVKRAIEAYLARIDENSAMKSEYVRRYLLSILEFCPTDYFRSAEGGGWELDESEYDLLPSEIKRLVESIDIRFERGVRVCSVKFISKAVALGLAARFSLTQKVEATVNVVNWDALPVSNDSGSDAIEAQIARVAADAQHGTVPGPVQAEATPVAQNGFLHRADGDH